MRRRAPLLLFVLYLALIPLCLLVRGNRRRTRASRSSCSPPSGSRWSAP